MAALYPQDFESATHLGFIPGTSPLIVGAELRVLSKAQFASARPVRGDKCAGERAAGYGAFWPDNIALTDFVQRIAQKFTPAAIMGLLMRAQAGTGTQRNGYTCTYEYSGGNLRGSISVYANGAQTADVSAYNIPVAIGDDVHTEASVVGTIIELRVWTGSNPRPSSPTVTATKSTYASGAAAIVITAADGNTYTGVDDWVVAEPSGGSDYFYAPDTIAPTLSAATSSAVGTNGATVGATTNEANGTMYAVATLAATAPTGPQIVAGQNAAGTAAAGAGSLAVTTVGAKVISIAGLSEGTVYYPHAVHVDAAGNISNVLSGASVTTAVPDTTDPTFTGVLTVGAVTATTIPVSWPAATDNVAVTSYETSVNGGAWIDRGNVLAHTFVGLTANTPYTLRARAKDAAGNVSLPLQVTQSTLAASDTTVPTMSGAVTPSAITQTTYTISGWGATDNVAVTGFELSLDGGATYADIGNVTTRNVTGRTAGATDSVRVRAYDAAGNRSAALSASVTLASAGTSAFLTDPVVNLSDSPIVLSPGWTVDFVHPTTGLQLARVTGLTTDANGRLGGTAPLAAGTAFRARPFHATHGDPLAAYTTT